VEYRHRSAFNRLRLRIHHSTFEQATTSKANIRNGSLFLRARLLLRCIDSVRTDHHYHGECRRYPLDLSKIFHGSPPCTICAPTHCMAD
jgi:hypothetical protein